LLWRRDDREGVVESDGSQAPHAVLPVVEHRQRVAVLVAGAEVCVSAVRGVAHVREGQREDFLNLWVNTKYIFIGKWKGGGVHRYWRFAHEMTFKQEFEGVHLFWVGFKGQVFNGTEVSQHRSDQHARL